MLTRCQYLCRYWSVGMNIKCILIQTHPYMTQLKEHFAPTWSLTNTHTQNTGLNLLNRCVCVFVLSLASCNMELWALISCLLGTLTGSGTQDEPIKTARIHQQPLKDPRHHTANTTNAHVPSRIWREWSHRLRQSWFPFGFIEKEESWETHTQIEMFFPDERKQRQWLLSEFRSCSLISREWLSCLE